MEEKELYNQIVITDKKLKATQYEEDYKIYEQLKSESETYGELKKKIVQLGRGIFYTDSNNVIGERLIKILDKEFEGLQIEKRMAELEGSVQVQPLSVKIKFTNLNELKDIISEINQSTQRLREFKLKTKNE